MPSNKLKKDTTEFKENDYTPAASTSALKAAGSVPPPPPDSIGEQSTYARTVILPWLLKSTFATINSPWLLILSLWMMAAQSLYYFYELSKLQVPLITLLPFILSIFGASVGAVWESDGIPLILKNLVQGFRIANVPAVSAAISISLLAQAFPALSESAVLLVLAVFLLFTASVSVVAMATGPTPALLGQIMLETVLVAAVAIYGSVLPAFEAIRGTVALRALFQLLGFFDPSAGTIFHFLNIAGGYYLFEGLKKVPVSLTSQWVAQITVGSLILYSILAVAIVVIFLKLVKPQSYSTLRFLFNDVIWQTIYAGLLIMPAWYPQPMREEIYASNPRVEFVPYGSTHPRATLYEFNGANFIPKAQQLFNGAMVKLIFNVIRFFDTFFPQARRDVKITDKNRVTGVYSNYFPKQLAAIVGPASEQRATVLEYRARGQMLAYVVNFGHASTMVSAGKNPDEVIMDLDFMNKFPSKPDFVKYGGVARFRVRHVAAASSSSDSTESTNFTPLLELVSVSAPNSKKVINVPAPTDPALADPLSEFRKVETVLLASTCANCVVAKHCAGIHSYFNLIAVSLHNAFDTQPWLQSAIVSGKNGKYPHPIRLALMPHFYNHVIVEELTTPHLLERYAVFPQIFNFTDEGLAQYYDRQFALFDLNSDADLSARFAVLGLDESSVSKLDAKSGTLAWEIQYHKIFLKYCTMLVEATYYESAPRLDDAVKADPLIRALAKELQAALPNKVPARYGSLDTVARLARFMADTIFCVSIRHQIYGVNTAHYCDDWLSVPNQVPVDYGVPAVEDYMSQLYVALATTRPLFILFKARDVAHRWNYLLAPLAKTVPDIYSRFSAAFDWLQKEFDGVEAAYSSNAVEKLVNFELNRALPSDLCPGSAY